MEITNFLVCDDIRNEIGNKKSLMGIYDSSIEFQVTPENKSQWPRVKRLGIFARIKFEKTDMEKGISSFEFKLKIDYNGDIKEMGKGVFYAEKVSMFHTANLAMVFDKFVFKEPGEIRFFLDFSNVKNDVIKTVTPDYILKISEKVI